MSLLSVTYFFQHLSMALAFLIKYFFDNYVKKYLFMKEEKCTHEKYL